MKNTNLITTLENEISKLENKDFTIYFYVIDTMGNPNQTIENIYTQAFILQELGYKTTILHEEEVGTYYGVSEWLGEQYAAITHKCITQEEIKINASDFLVIPEILSNVMVQTKKMPCKKIVLCDNYDKIFEFLPLSTTWKDLGISEVITTNHDLKKQIVNIFPYYQDIKIIEPHIDECFKSNENQLKELSVSVFCQDQGEMMRFVKEFLIKSPIYRWLTFKDIRNMTPEAMATTLQKSAIALVLDTNDHSFTNALKAIKSDCITLCKTDGYIPEWAYADTTQLNCMVYSTSNDTLIKTLTAVVDSWCSESVPSVIYEDMNVVKDVNNKIDYIKKINETYSTFVDQRIAELTKIKDNQ